MSEYIKSIFGIEYEKVKEFFSDLSKVDKNSVIPRGRVINVYIVMRAENELLIRHEGGEDISLAALGKEKYPIILYDKFQSAWRRKELELLRHDYDKHKENINKIRGNNEDWFCALRPSGAVKRAEEKMGGQCGECPDCVSFGYAVREGGKYNVKSRIEGDLLIATTPETKSVVVRTFNAVDDVTKTTLIEGEETGRTGALFRLSLVKEGTLFVGKVVMKDLSVNDFLLKLASLTALTKIGGKITHFGNVKIIIPAVMFSTFEVSSSYDMFSIAKSEGEDVDKVINSINSHLDKVKRGILVTGKDFSENIRKSLFTDNGEVVHKVVEEAWREGINFKKSIEDFLSK